MTLLERLTQDLTAAMKAQDAVRTSVLRLAKSSLKNKEIDKKAPLDDAEVQKVLQTLVRQREESIEQFQKGNRPELVAKELVEAAILRTYLPEQASAAQIEAAVEAAVSVTGAVSQKDMGKVMKVALAALQAAGQPVDGKQVSEAVRKRLAG